MALPPAACVESARELVRLLRDTESFTDEEEWGSWYTAYDDFNVRV